MKDAGNAFDFDLDPAEIAASLVEENGLERARQITGLRMIDQRGARQGGIYAESGHKAHA